MSVLVGKQAPLFKAMCAFSKGGAKEIQLDAYRSQYVILFFYPLDFTFVCPTELMAFQQKLDEFTALNTVVLGCSVDSHFSHSAWLNTPQEKGGIQGVEYGLIADLGGKIANAYDVLNHDLAVAYRGLFLIDKTGIVRHQLVNDLPLGRSVDEALRMVQALQHVEDHGEVCPANWTINGEAIVPDAKSTATYLKKIYG